jgi:uncharacterized phage-associated protein
VAGGKELDRAKFKELVLHLAQASAEDEGFGMVKLNKLLYRADFEAYRLLGKSITGETYEKQDYGPVARELPRALDELGKDQRMQWQHIPSGPYVRDVPEPRETEAADVSLFTDEEMKIVRRALEELAEHGAKSVSQWSHETSAGWRVKQIGEEIPYSSAMINLEPLSREARDSFRDKVVARL